jgi:hypothetical protein
MASGTTGQIQDVLKRREEFLASHSDLLANLARWRVGGLAVLSVRRR